MTDEKDPPSARNIHKNCSLVGHKFEARYSYGEVSNPIFTLSGSYRASDFARMNEALKSKTYIHDICVICGKIVKETKEELT